jgi:hypothetical protein
MPTISTTQGNPQMSQIAVQDALGFTGNASRMDGQTVLNTIDADLARANADKNFTLAQGGSITYNGTTVTFAEDLKLFINSTTSGSVVTKTMVAGTYNVTTNGNMLYVVLDNRTASTTLTLTAASTLPTNVAANKEVVLIAKRSDDSGGAKRLYFSNGSAFTEGQSAKLGASGGAGETVDRITQASHAFAAGDVLYYTGSAYAKAKADAANTAEIVGMVSKVIDSNTFELTLEGKITGLTGLTSGEVYFLSAATAGAITVTEPSVLGNISLPIGVAVSTTVFYVKSSRGVTVGGTNARTEIALSNNATVTVQDVSPYQAGELTGWVEIDAGTDYKFYFSAPFAKNSAGSDYNISPSYVGETPPAGFSITVTAAGLVQATLPNLGSFVSSKTNFALNAPAVGATFPLTIDSTSVQFNTVKAKDSGGIVFQENGGTQTGAIADSGAFSLGSPSTGAITHTAYSTGGAIIAADMIHPTNEARYELRRNGVTKWNIASGGAGDDYAVYSGSVTAIKATSAGDVTLGASGVANGHLIYGANITLQTTNASANAQLVFKQTTGTVGHFAIGTNVGSGSASDIAIYSYNAGATIGTISSVGVWTLGATTTDGTHIINNSSSGNYVTVSRNYHASNPNGAQISYMAAAPNGTGNPFIVCDDTGGNRFIVRSNGGIANYQANDINLSDERLKTNITPTSPKLDFICSLQVKDFQYKDKPGVINTGLIAQDVEALNPFLVQETGNQQIVDGDEINPKAIRTTEIYHMMIKAIQELKAELDAAKARIATLEGGV